jgi:hypothetical protein
MHPAIDVNLRFQLVLRVHVFTSMLLVDRQFQGDNATSIGGATRTYRETTRYNGGGRFDETILIERVLFV